MTYRVYDLLVDLKLYVWKICSAYFEFARERKFIRYWIKHNSKDDMVSFTNFQREQIIEASLITYPKEWSTPA